MSFVDHEGALRAHARAAASNKRALPGDTYTVGVACTNCEYTGPFTLPKGVQFGRGHECPGCGCRTLTRTMARRPTLAHGGRREKFKDRASLLAPEGEGGHPSPGSRAYEFDVLGVMYAESHEEADAAIGRWVDGIVAHGGSVTSFASTCPCVGTDDQEDCPHA